MILKPNEKAVKEKVFPEDSLSMTPLFTDVLCRTNTT